MSGYIHWFLFYVIFNALFRGHLVSLWKKYHIYDDKTSHHPTKSCCILLCSDVHGITWCLLSISRHQNGHDNSTSKERLTVDSTIKTFEIFEVKELCLPRIWTYSSSGSMISVLPDDPPELAVITVLRQAEFVLCVRADRDDAGPDGVFIAYIKSAQWQTCKYWCITVLFE